MSGFDCEFVRKPPKAFQTDCPVCLLIIREPYQVTCCGKSFCKECIGKIKAGRQPCPTCKQDNYEFFPNKGLQLPLCGFAVFCSNKERGCVWEGELGQLDQHINSNPDKKRLVGCPYTNIACLFCTKLHWRHEMEWHQTSSCPKRPSICSMCMEYQSTYEDVVNSHIPVCKCRPVECPNSCGADKMQHQHLDEHVSSQCPLTSVECEFSDAGCDAKVYRKDLASHLTDNLVSHMSLLATENRRFKQQLEEQKEKSASENKIVTQQVQKQGQVAAMEIKKLKEETGAQLATALREFIQSPFFRVLPQEMLCPVHHTNPIISDPMYTHIGGYKLQLHVYLYPMNNSLAIFFVFVESELHHAQPYPALKVTIVLVDQQNEMRNRSFQSEIYSIIPTEVFPWVIPDLMSYVKNDYLLFRVFNITRSS